MLASEYVPLLGFAAEKVRKMEQELLQVKSPHTTIQDHESEITKLSLEKVSLIGRITELTCDV